MKKRSNKALQRTFAGVLAGIGMALELVARLAGREISKRIQLGLEYDPRPPFRSEQKMMGKVSRCEPCLPMFEAGTTIRCTRDTVDRTRVLVDNGKSKLVAIGTAISVPIGEFSSDIRHIFHTEVY